MAVDPVFRNVTGQGGETFEQGFSNAIAGDTRLRDAMGRRGTNPLESQATRQLVAEKIAVEQGRGAADIGDPASQRFIYGPKQEERQTDRFGNTSPEFIGTREQREAGITVDPITGEVVSVPETGVSAVDRFARDERMTEEEFRQQEMANIQDELARINAQYDARIAEAQQVGEGRLGQQRSLSSVGGTRFTPIAATQEADVERFNQRQINEIERERQAALQTARDTALGLGTQRFQSQEDQIIDEAAQYLTALAGDRSFGLDVAGLSQSDRQFNARQRLNAALATGLLGGAPTLDRLKFLQGQTEFDETLQLQRDQLNQRIAEAQEKNLQVVQTADGTVFSFDPQTGEREIIGNFGRQTGGGGAGGSQFGPGTEFSAAEQDQFNQIARDYILAQQVNPGLTIGQYVRENLGSDDPAETAYYLRGIDAALGVPDTGGEQTQEEEPPQRSAGETGAAVGEGTRRFFSETIPSGVGSFFDFTSGLARGFGIPQIESTTRR